MKDPAAIQATFSDFKTVKTRSVAQLVFEIPIEQADMALKALGGVPQPQAEQWVAVARLNEKAVQSDPEPVKTRLQDRTRAAQMQRLCGVAEFQNFMSQKNPNLHIYAEMSPYGITKALVKDLLGIESSNDLDEDRFVDAQDDWDTLLAEYQQSQGRMAEKR